MIINVPSYNLLHAMGEIVDPIHSLTISILILGQYQA